MTAGFHSVVESIREGVVVVDGRMRIRYANPYLKAITGHPTERIVGRRIDTVIAPPDAAERVRAHSKPV